MGDAPSAWKIEQAMATWQAARARLLQDDPELGHDEAALAEVLGDEAGDVDNILARLLRASVYAADMSSAASDRIAEIKGRQDRYKRRADAMRGTAFAIMDAIGRDRVELPDLTASVRKGHPVVVWTDKDAVPELYVETVTTRRIDTATVLSVLKSGQSVPGAELSNGIPSLTVRTK